MKNEKPTPPPIRPIWWDEFWTFVQNFDPQRDAGDVKHGGKGGVVR